MSDWICIKNRIYLIVFEILLVFVFVKAQTGRES